MVNGSLGQGRCPHSNMMDLHGSQCARRVAEGRRGEDGHNSAPFCFQLPLQLQLGPAADNGSSSEVLSWITEVWCRARHGDVFDGG